MMPHNDGISPSQNVDKHLLSGSERRMMDKPYVFLIRFSYYRPNKVPVILAFLQQKRKQVQND
jgi:hypothetical protein